VTVAAGRAVPGAIPAEIMIIEPKSNGKFSLAAAELAAASVRLRLEFTSQVRRCFRVRRGRALVRLAGSLALAAALHDWPGTVTDCGRLATY
jgi:hypothetical protein